MTWRFGVLPWTRECQTEGVGTRGRIRVAMINASPFPTDQGSQVLVRDLAQALTRHGVQVALIAYDEGLSTDTGGLEVLRPRGFVPLDPVRYRSGPSLRRILHDARLVGRLGDLARQGQVDLLHGHNYEGALVGLAVRARCRLPVVYHSHNLMAEELPTYFGTGIARRIAGWLGFLLDCTVPRMADHVVALTEAAARGLRKRGVRRDRLSVVPPGIRFSPSELATTETGPRPARSYLYAGNLDRYQNLEFLLHVARRVAAEVPGAQLEIATHRDTREIAASIRAAGLGEREVRCLRLGSFLDLRARLWAGRVAVCPRVTSGSLPIKLINYLQHGLAVVAFESCGAGITHLSTGWLAPDKDLGMFARGVTAFLKDPALAEAVGREAQRWAIWEFDPDRAAHRVETIYSDVVPRADRAYPPGQRSPASSTTPLLESHFRPGWSDRGGLFPPEPGAVGKEVPR